MLACPVAPVDPEPTGGESEDVRWVDVADLDTLPLHPGFAAAWPRLRDAPPPLRIVVDAANVIGARGRGDGWWRDRAGAAARLLDALVPVQDGLAPAELPPGVDAGELDRLLPWIVVVVEGAARAVLDSGGRWPLDLVAAPGSGDDTLVELSAEACRDQIVVVTADRGLAGPAGRGRRRLGRAVLAAAAGGRHMMSQAPPAVGIRSTTLCGYREGRR